MGGIRREGRRGEDEGEGGRRWWGVKEGGEEGGIRREGRREGRRGEDEGEGGRRWWGVKEGGEEGGIRREGRRGG